jgi:hypothetical protein
MRCYFEKGSRTLEDIVVSQISGRMPSKLDLSKRRQRKK